MRAIVLLAAVLAACAQEPVKNLAREEPRDSVVPAAAGVRVGDVVLRYNGEAVTTPRQFYRLVVDSRPGSVAQLELLRDGAVRTLEVPVGELDTMPRA